MSDTARFPLGPFLALAFGACAIALAGIFVRLSDVNPMASAFWRMALASPVLWLLALRERRDGTPQPLPRGAVVGSGIFFAGDLVLWHWALSYTTVANATLASNCAPIFVALGLWLCYGKAPSRLFVAAIAVALTGAALMVGPHFGGGDRLLGDVMGFSSAVFYGGYQLTVKAARERISTARLMAWSTTLSALVLLPFAVLTPGPLLPQTAAGWTIVLALAFISQIGGQAVIAYAFAHLPAAFSSVSLLIQPVMAGVFAWLIFHETLSAVQLAGAALVLGGIAMAKRG